MNDSFWATARAQMLLDAAVANLNTGSFGPLPRPVFERVTVLRQRLAEEPMDFLLRGAPPLLWEARTRLAQFVGADPRRLVFTANVTAAINLVASSLSLEAPGEVLMTDHEYGAMQWAWERAAQRQGLTVRTFPLPAVPSEPGEVVAAAKAALTNTTRLLFFSHVLSPTGMILPARELCAAARKRGIPTVVDGAHAPAFVPLDLDSIGADFYSANCHKWLLAPTGSGFLHLGLGNEDALQPLQVSWGWNPDRARLDEPDEFGSTPRLRLLEFEGTRDPCPWLAVPAALDFQAALGWQAIRERIATLAGHTRRRLGGELGLTLATPMHPALHGAMTAFRLPAGPGHPRQRVASELRQRLWQEYRIEVPIIERPEGLLVRVSTHFFNTEEEVDRLCVALDRLVLR
ncbi:MAG: aminotransferase class V-fold PLP-dependent enzyme [Planctomycetes bacterium]|nr:aminotransferase class V-fold PLP-dependent enzyme [Planctomycetota bacterium]